MRLACVKHAASVRSEPGSNSQVHPNQNPRRLQPERTDPGTSVFHPPTQNPHQGQNPTGANVRKRHPKRTVTHQKDTPTKRPKQPTDQAQDNPRPTNQPPTRPPNASTSRKHKDAANVSLPSLCCCERTLRRRSPQQRPGVRRGSGLLGAGPRRVNAHRDTFRRGASLRNTLFPTGVFGR